MGITSKAAERGMKEKFSLLSVNRGDGSGPGGCTRSKTITTGKGEMIANVLKVDAASLHYSSKFRYWLKQRGFKLISHLAIWPEGCSMSTSLEKGISYCKCFIAVRAPTLFVVEPY